MVDRELYDPAGFATESMRYLRGRFVSLCTLEAPKALAAYQKARAAYLRSLPDGEPAYPHPFHTMDEAVFDAVGAAYEAGLAAGTHWEGLRQSLIPPVLPCPRCRGIGSLGEEGHWMMGSETPCPECQGAGTVGPTTDD